ncbi:hypothetical protein HXX76_016193 [Chlamydomonas incerta]|uniref:GED domain-containing protein n=1 Tax=Chlamydomonas incerta TaxID=51695 RepID=A0A835SLM0_CHLIN|nr:hypothetical protein HXX76_016193 [Chlamydomonas incerta]|eukprot:KAG2422241.1 hypothetical protein HXX76_016193 [Chlamydomonas incerta]
MRTHASTASPADGGDSSAADWLIEGVGANGADGSGSVSGNGGGQRSPWQCRIKLSRAYDSEDKPLAEKPPEQLFCVVTDKAHITACVSAAQAVLLNPRVVEGAVGGPQAYVPELSSAQPGCRPADSAPLRALGDAACYELAFTSNKVVLEIDGAEADLTIIDLPGIIHDHAKGLDTVKAVERMSRTHLAPAHHIIVIAQPAGHDLETQAIRRFAREVDPQGHRSIGIITKPDRISEEAHIEGEKLVRLVATRGELGAAVKGGKRSAAQLAEQPPPPPQQHPEEQQAAAADGHLRLGYYVVKNPSQEQRRGCACACELFRLLWRVADTLDGAVHARSDSCDRTFYQRLAAHYRAYGDRTIRSTPAFLVGTTLISALSKSDKNMRPADIAAAAAAAGEGDGSDDGEVDLAALTWPPTSPSTPDGGGSPVGSGRIRTGAQAEAALTSQGAELRALLDKHMLPTRPMTLAELSRLRDRHLGRELPGFSPYSAMEELLRRFQGQWREHAEGCLQEVEAAVRELAGSTVAEELQRFPKAERVVEAALSSHLDSLLRATEAQIDELVGMEDGDVFTLNDHYLRDSQAAFLARLKRAYLRPQPLDADSKHAVQNLLGQLSSYGINFRSYESAFLAQPTPVDDELHMAASCLAYFKVAFKRIQDEVPMAIRKTLLRRLGNRQQLEAALREQLPDVAAAAPLLLEEDPAVAERRRQCGDMMRRLREALAVLNSPAAQL